MVSNTELDARLSSVETAHIQREQNTVKFSEMTAAQKRLIIENVFPSGVWIDINDPNLKVGDKVAGKKAGINGGQFVQGYVLTAPPTTDAHIDAEYESL